MVMNVITQSLHKCCRNKINSTGILVSNLTWHPVPLQWVWRGSGVSYSNIPFLRFPDCSVLFHTDTADEYGNSRLIVERPACFTATGHLYTSSTLPSPRPTVGWETAHHIRHQTLQRGHWSGHTATFFSSGILSHKHGKVVLAELKQGDVAVKCVLQPLQHSPGEVSRTPQQEKGEEGEPCDMK